MCIPYTYIIYIYIIWYVKNVNTYQIFCNYWHNKGAIQASYPLSEFVCLAVWSFGNHCYYNQVTHLTPLCLWMCLQKVVQAMYGGAWGNLAINIAGTVSSTVIHSLEMNTSRNKHWWMQLEGWCCNRNKNNVLIHLIILESSIIDEGVLSGNGLCLEGIMYGGGFVRKWLMSRGSYVWRGFCPRGFCPRTLALAWAKPIVSAMGAGKLHGPNRHGNTHKHPWVCKWFIT